MSMIGSQELHTIFNDHVSNLVNSIKEAMKDGGFSFEDGFRIFVRSVASLVSLASKLGELAESGDLRDEVVAGTVKIYDEVIAPIDIPGVPNFIEKTVLDPALGKAIPGIVGAIYDSLRDIIENHAEDDNEINLL